MNSSKKNQMGLLYLVHLLISADGVIDEKEFASLLRIKNRETIAFQGANGANSNLACIKFYPEMQAQAFDSFYDVFTAVENNQAKYGIIPLENSYAGRVAEIHDLLQKHDVSIVAEHFFPITHHQTEFYQPIHF